jgi:DNA-binding NarL/FixJ family response regulator
MNSVPPSPPIRVALVEDNVAFRRGLKAILGLTPGLVCAGIYPNAEEAIREIPSVIPDVVLMDLNLPGRSGVECTSEIKARLSDVEVVMLTIEEDGERIFSALRAGAAGYLLKTATPAEIVEAIHLVSRGGSPMSAEIARRVVESFHGTQALPRGRESLSPRKCRCWTASRTASG